MFRVLTTIAAIAVLAVSAAPASAGSSSTKSILYNGHAGLITNGAADDQMKSVCDVAGFMDYTDDSCMAKTKGSGLAKAKVPRRSASLSGGVPDGTSNTIGIVKPKPRSLNTFGGDDTL